MKLITKNHAAIKTFWEHFVPLPTNIQTPVNTDLVAVELEDYLFPELAEYLVSGLREGFHLHVGYTGPRFAIIASKNLKSARDNAAQVTEAIVKELRRGHIAGLPPLLKTYTAFPWGQWLIMIIPDTLLLICLLLMASLLTLCMWLIFLPTYLEPQRNFRKITQIQLSNLQTQF